MGYGYISSPSPGINPVTWWGISRSVGLLSEFSRSLDAPGHLTLGLQELSDRADRYGCAPVGPRAGVEMEAFLGDWLHLLSALRYQFANHGVGHPSVKADRGGAPSVVGVNLDDD